MSDEGGRSFHVFAWAGRLGGMGENTFYYGDNLDILRRYVADESVDLIYLDPPFNSNADYNVLFAEKDGTQARPAVLNHVPVSATLQR